MAWTDFDHYGEAEVVTDSAGNICVKHGTVIIHLCAKGEAARIRDELSRKITEVAIAATAPVPTETVSA